MKDVVEIFKQIKETSSRTGKEATLKANEGNTEFRRILEFMYNPFILTGIKAKKLVKFSDYVASEGDDVPQFDTVFDAISYLSTNNSGRDVDVKAIANFINTYADTNSFDHDFLQEMFTKDYKCGITASTINKIYGKGTISEFDVMLAKSFKDHGRKLNGVFYVTLKHDGIRCVAIKKNGVVQFYTRQGQPIYDLVEIEREIVEELPENYVYDGELLLKPNGMNSADLFRATQKVVRKDGVKEDLQFHIFDMIPVDEFMGGKSSETYEVRRDQWLEVLFHGENYRTLRLVEVLYKGNDKSVISDLLSKVIDNGEEGLMINTADGHYVTKRSDVLLKVKEMHTVDLKVVGYEEGSGKYKGTLGALIVDYKGYEVKVGSGYSDLDRKTIWDIGEDIIGQIVEVQYFEESSNQEGGISLRFPVFLRIRDDKDEPSLH